MFPTIVILSLLSFAQAWMPGEHKQIISRDGVDLFNRSSLHEAGLLQKRYLPSSYGNDKNAIRGVNLGSLFIVENWMAGGILSGFGCSTESEFDCVASLNDQSKANADFQGHWEDFLSPSDFAQMVSYGLNTVRVPIGYWFLESIVDSSERFAQGGEAYLDQVVGWAKDAGLYVIVVLHGAPGAQVTDPFTGQDNPDPGFYSDYNYGRAYQWLQWMTNKVHTNGNYSTVGMIELVNEPERTWDTANYPNAAANTQSMLETYYPTAWTTIRNEEDSLSVSTSSRLHIQMMDNAWGSGTPTTYLSDTTFAAFDDHDYVKYSGIAADMPTYLAHSCTSDRSSGQTSETPLIVGEWSLSVDSSVEGTADWAPSTHVEWYKQWWAAQVMAYETTANGWIFWSWKTQGLNDPRWDYRLAVELGIIDANPDVAYEMGVCQ